MKYYLEFWSNDHWERFCYRRCAVRAYMHMKKLRIQYPGATWRVQPQ